MATISIESRYRNRGSETPTPAPSRYARLNKQYIGGIWRDGKEGSKLIDVDPFSGETLVEIVQANKTDLDEAYQPAEKAQVSWAARNPAERVRA